MKRRVLTIALLLSLTSILGGCNKIQSEVSNTKNTSSPVGTTAQVSTSENNSTTQTMNSTVLTMNELLDKLQGEWYNLNDENFIKENGVQSSIMIEKEGNDYTLVEISPDTAILYKVSSIQYLGNNNSYLITTHNGDDQNNIDFTFNMWLYRSGNDRKSPIVLYDYQPSRNGDHAVAYLKEFKGYVHSDGYSGYNKLKNITRVGCWAHLRRKFVEAIPTKKTVGPPTNAEIGRQYCDKLFAIEDSLKDLLPKDRFCKRLELEKPVLEAFWCWLDSLHTLKGSALGKAVTYAQNQKPYMENYLLDGRCSLSNNAAENAIRPFTVGRKNWLFADTPKGVTASAVVYSLVETAKANGLNVYKYLKYLLMYMSASDWRNYPDLLDDILPWNPEVQRRCKK